jgi:formylglycine-generating enzyme required for sulfatase activity
MKYFFSILLIISIALPAQSQKQIRKGSYSKDPKGMKFIPPGSFNYDLGAGEKTISIQGFWMSNEITNKEFREFYEDIKAYPDSSFSWYDFTQRSEDKNYTVVSINFSQILDELIDESLWTKIPGYENYFRSKAFDNFPVTGVSYKSAQYFCWWKSKRETQNNNNKKHYLIQYRLPQKVEWEYAAFTGSEGKQLVALAAGKPQKIKSGIAVNFGLYNMFDNAAEFVRNDVLNEALIVTYSWHETGAKEIYKKVDKDYRDRFTGFRIVRTYISTKMIEKP